MTRHESVAMERRRREEGDVVTAIEIVAFDAHSCAQSAQACTCKIVMSRRATLDCARSDDIIDLVKMEKEGERAK